MITIDMDCARNKVRWRGFQKLRIIATVVLLVLGVAALTQGAQTFPTRVIKGQGKYTLKVKAKGSESPFAGNWEWKGSRVGSTNEPHNVKMKIKIKGKTLTGSWSDTWEQSEVGLNSTAIADGEIVSADTFTFRRCWSHDRIYEPHSQTYFFADRFVKCKRNRDGTLKANLHVVYYTGKISGNDLTVTSTE